MIDGKTYYEILGLDKYGVNYLNESVSQESIYRRYSALKYGNNYEDRLSDWQLGPVEEAYRVLSDVTLRKEYDQKLRNKEFDNLGIYGPSVIETPVEPEPTPVEPEPTPVEPEPTPVEPEPTPVEPEPTPVEPEPTPVEPEPTPVEPEPTPVEPEPTPVEPEPTPVEPEPTPVEPEPTPVEPEPTPVEPEPTPVEPEPTPVEPEPTPVEPEPTPVEPEPTPVKDTGTLSKEDEKYVISVSREVPENTKRKKAAVIIGSAIVGGPAGAVIGVVLASKLFGKAKLQKEKKKKRITKVSIEETQIIESANQQLDNDIYELLSKPNNNYKLAIARLKYKNQVDLLKKRIEFKENQQIKKGGLVKYKLELMALRRQLETSEKRLKALNENVEEYSRKSKLNALNEELINSSREIEANTKVLKKEQSYTSAERKEMVSSIKKLEIKRTKSQEQRDAKARRMVLNKNGIARNQYYLYAFDVVKNKIGQFFNRTEDVDSQSIKLEEEVKKR